MMDAKTQEERGSFVNEVIVILLLGRVVGFALGHGVIEVVLVRGSET